MEITPAVHTPFADLDLLLSEAEHAQAARVAAAEARGGDVPDPVDALDARILAGLVSP